MTLSGSMRVSWVLLVLSLSVFCAAGCGEESTQAIPDEPDSTSDAGDGDGDETGDGDGDGDETGDGDGDGDETGDGDGDAPFACPPSSAPTTNGTVCGQIFDAQTQEPLGDPLEACTPCGPDDSDGPCGFEIRVYDPLNFAADPDNTEPLTVGDQFIDTCGRYRVEEIPAPFLGFAAITLTGGSDYRSSGSITELSGGDVVEEFPAFAVRVATDDQWTTSAGDPFGDESFADNGVNVWLFRDSAGAPVPDASISPTSEILEDVAYFADLDSQLSLVAADRATTGVNGAALVWTGILDQTGCETCGAPDGCTWTREPAVFTPGFVMFTRPQLITGAGAPCPVEGRTG